MANSDATNNLKSKRVIALLALIIICSSLIAWSYFQQRKAKLTVSGTVQAAEVEFGSRQGGRISQVVKQEGDFLQKNEVILEIENNELIHLQELQKAEYEAEKAKLQELENGLTTEEIQQAKAKYLEAKSNFELQKQGYRKQDLEAQKANFSRAKSDLKRAESSLERKRQLFEKALITKDQLEEEENQYQQTVTRFNEAKQNLSKYEEGFRTEEVEQSMYRMDSLKAAYEEVLRGPRKEIIEKQKQKVNASFAKLNELNSKVKELEVKSPCDCELAEFDNQVGDLIAANQVLGVLIDISDVWVEVYLPEKLYGKVWPGDKVKVSSYAHAQSAFNKSNLTGTVSYVALKSEYTPRNIQTIEGRLEQVFKVKIKLNNRQKLFRPGMDLEMNFDFNKSKPKEASK